MLGGIDQSATATVEIFLDVDRNRAGLTGRQIVAPDVSGLLEYDRLLSNRRELDVEIGEMRELRGFLRHRIDREEVHPVVAIRDEIDFVVRSPHRTDVLRGIVGQIFSRAGFEIVKPDIIRHAAAIMFPRTELSENAVERHL